MQQKNKEKINIEIGHIFNKRYKIKLKLKSGGFGSVYLATDLQTKGKYVAVKVMHSKDKFYSEMEFKMYQKFAQNKFTHGFVKHIDYGIQENKLFLIMQLLDKDLQTLIFKSNDHKFSLKSVLMIGLQVVDRLEAFHKIGYLHRDVKPDNLAIGFQEKNKIIYLIDFGLAKKINQIRPSQKGKVVGTLAFMSCKAHQAKQMGVAHDLQSLIYSMIFMLNGNLPWMKIKIQKIEDAHKILILKKKISQQDFKDVKIPKGIFQLLKDFQQSSENTKIDYLQIKYKMLEMLKNIKQQNDFCFDWSKNRTLSPNKINKGIDNQVQKLKVQKMKEQNQKNIEKQIFQVYNFLQQKKQPLSNKEIGRLNKKNVQSVQKNIKNIRPSSAAHKRIAVGDCKKQKMNINLRTQIDLIGAMQYCGPNIVINKTAKHKI